MRIIVLFFFHFEYAVLSQYWKKYTPEFYILWVLLMTLNTSVCIQIFRKGDKEQTSSENVKEICLVIRLGILKMVWTDKGNCWNSCENTSIISLITYRPQYIRLNAVLVWHSYFCFSSVSNFDGLLSLYLKKTEHFNFNRWYI